MTWKSKPLMLILLLVIVNLGSSSDSANQGTVIVAARTSSVGGLGHVGVAFQNADGTWTAGAIEGAPKGTLSNLGGAQVWAGDMNGGWVKKYNTREEVIAEFSSNTLSEGACSGYPCHAAYDKIKIISVEDSNPKLANDRIQSFDDKTGYTLAFNDCLTQTWGVLNAYGFKNAGFFVVGTDIVDTMSKSLERLGGLTGSIVYPNDYFDSLPGKAISLPQPSSDLRPSTRETAKSMDDSNTKESSTALVNDRSFDSVQETAKSMDDSNTKESSTALANDRSFDSVQETAKSVDDSNTKENSVIPTLYPITNPPPDESNTKKSSVIPMLYPTNSPPPDEQAETQEPSFGDADTSFGKPSSSSDVQSQKFGSSSESDLGGINFTSIKLNSIAVSTDQEGGINFDLVLKAQKAEGVGPGIDLINSTSIGATAFVTGLSIHANKFWVNLDPWEEDRIIDEQLSQSDVGRIMLEADLQMKKDFSNYGNPCANETGKAQGNLLDKKRESLVQQCMNRFPGEIKDINNVWFLPVTKHDIVPDKIYAYTNGTQIYIINASLTVDSKPMPISDRISYQVNNQDIGTISKGCLELLNKYSKEFGEYRTELQVRMIQPYVVADLNRGEKYEDLREVYVALALAQWYKSCVNSRMDIFRDSLDSPSSTVLKSQKPWSPNEIWAKFVYSFKNGEYKCWKNSTTETAGGTRTNISYGSAGGVEFANIKDHVIEIGRMPPDVQDQVKRAVSDGFINDGGGAIFFGNRLHLDRKNETSYVGSTPVSSSESLNSKQEPKNPSNKNKEDNTLGLNSEKAQGQSKETPSVAKVAGNPSHISCPDGWMGPDENGECWQMQITS
jgi:hypothetical protein